MYKDSTIIEVNSYHVIYFTKIEAKAEESKWLPIIGHCPDW